MAGLDFDTLTGELSIDASATGHTGTWLSLHCAAWCVMELRDLWLPAAQRGSDLLIPGLAGVRPRKRRSTVTTHDLPLVVTGEASPSGVAPSCGTNEAQAFHNQMVQLQANLAALAVGIIAPTGVGDGTRAARVLMPDGTTRTADVHVLGFAPGERMLTVQVGMLQLSVPGGAFT